MIDSIDDSLVVSLYELSNESLAELLNESSIYLVRACVIVYCPLCISQQFELYINNRSHNKYESSSVHYFSS